jgi:hypothetical protein
MRAAGFSSSSYVAMKQVYNYYQLGLAVRTSAHLDSTHITYENITIDILGRLCLFTSSWTKMGGTGNYCLTIILPLDHLRNFWGHKVGIEPTLIWNFIAVHCPDCSTNFYSYKCVIYGIFLCGCGDGIELYIRNIYTV